MADEINSKDKLDYSEATQAQIISELMRNRDFSVSVIHNLKPQYFTKDKFSDIVKVLTDFIDKYKSVPVTADEFLDHFLDVAATNKTLTLDDQIKGFVRAIYHRNPDGTYSFQYNVKPIHGKVNGFVREAAMKDALWASVNKLGENKETKFADILSLVVKAYSVGVSNIGTHLCEDINVLLERFKASRERRARIPTPVDRINVITNGGIGKKELFVILAPPNKGKSLSMCSFAATALNNQHKVVYYTLEMSEEKIAWRLIQNLGNFTEAELMMNPPQVAERLKRIHQRVSTDISPGMDGGSPVATHNNRDIIIKHFTSKSCNVHTLYSHLAILEAQGFIPDVIFIDYADLMTPSKSYSDKRAELSSIYTELRDMGVEKNIAIVTASQANRSSLSQDLVSIEHIAEDFGKVAIADIIVTISQNATERSSNRLRMYMAKNRDGVVDDVINVFVNYSTMTLGDVSDNFDDVNTALAAPTQ